MRINSNFKLREIAGETLIVNQGRPDADLTRILSLNTSARYLWEALSGRAFTADEAAALLAERYGISHERVANDIAAWLDALRKCGILVEE